MLVSKFSDSILAQHCIFIPDCDSGFGSSLICGGSSISPDMLRPLVEVFEANRPHLRCKELWGRRRGCLKEEKAAKPERQKGEKTR